MVRIFLVSIMFLVLSCEKKLYDLGMEKIPYDGNELKINGYYYSTPDSNGDIGLAVFYRDGFCIHMFLDINSKDTLHYIENKYLLDNAFIIDIKQTPNWIGVFQIDNSKIEYETWVAMRHIPTFSYYGEILNDTTYKLTKWIANDIDVTYPLELTYKFKKFDFKPDSTNTFIK